MRKIIITILNGFRVKMKEIREFHLFAGIGGGIYGGRLLGHKCVGGVEIDEFCQNVLRQRQTDGWMEKFDIYGDLTKLGGYGFRGKFDILCGGFPCQAFSTAAHGNNIAAKNLWDVMRQFVEDSEAPVVFGENVTFKAIDKARCDLKGLGYKVQICKLSCHDLGADHIRTRFWLLAVKDRYVFYRLVQHLVPQPKIRIDSWTQSPYDMPGIEIKKGRQLKAIGNAQSPYVAAVAFRILVNRHILDIETKNENVSEKEISEVFVKQQTWIKREHPEIEGFVHTPTTIANYSTPSMQKHQGCRNYLSIFGRPNPRDAEYLMGFPIGASSPEPIGIDIPQPWIPIITSKEE